MCKDFKENYLELICFCTSSSLRWFNCWGCRRETNPGQPDVQWVRPPRHLKLSSHWSLLGVWDCGVLVDGREDVPELAFFSGISVTCLVLAIFSFLWWEEDDGPQSSHWWGAGQTQLFAVLCRRKTGLVPRLWQLSPFCFPQEFPGDFSRLGKPGKDTISITPVQQLSKSIWVRETVWWCLCNTE